MKVLIVALALFVASTSAIQDSLEPTDLEVSPSSMSKTCADIFAPLQSKAVNDRRDECKKQYSHIDNKDDVSCEIRCILINTGFVDRESGKPLINLFKQGVDTVYKGNEKMVDRIVAAFSWCYTQAELAPVDPNTCSNPAYTRYGMCLYEMVRKLCQMELNANSNVQEPWGKSIA